MSNKYCIWINSSGHVLECMKSLIKSSRLLEFWDLTKKSITRAAEVNINILGEINLIPVVYTLQTSQVVFRESEK